VDQDSYTTLKFERVGKVLRVVIDNPSSDINWFDEALQTDLTRLFGELRDEREARAVLLTGSKKAFLAGGDPQFVMQMRDSAILARSAHDAKQMIWDLLDVEIPVVAAINGDAVALGASIALLCDVIFMAESAVLRDPHVLLGLVAGDGGVVAWPLAVGPALAKRYLLTGDPVSAPEAERLGLVTHVVSDEELQSAALAFAQRIAAEAPLAVRYTKMAVNKLVKQAMNTNFDSALGHELVTFLSDDLVEAMSAMQSGREPKFEAR
jgi:enoyl-CoA hydratase